MLVYLKKIQELKVFTLAEFENITPSPRAAQELLRVYCHKGYVKKVRRNLYCASDLASGAIAAGKFEIGSHISDTSYISYHSALEFHGLSHQVFYDVTVCSKSRFNGFEYDGIEYHFSPSVLDEGVISPELNAFVRVTDLERTIVDCIDKINLSGGIEELMQALRMVSFVDESKLRRYLKLYDKKILYKKAGYLLSFYQDNLRLKDSFYALCHKKGDSVLSALSDRAESVKYNAQWNLYVPENINDYITQGNYALI